MEAEGGTHNWRPRHATRPGASRERQSLQQRKLCRHWLAGKCTYGDRCSFVHDEPSEIQAGLHRIRAREQGIGLQWGGEQKRKVTHQEEANAKYSCPKCSAATFTKWKQCRQHLLDVHHVALNQKEETKAEQAARRKKREMVQDAARSVVQDPGRRLVPHGAVEAGWQCSCGWHGIGGHGEKFQSGPLSQLRQLRSRFGVRRVLQWCRTILSSICSL